MTSLQTVFCIRVPSGVLPGSEIMLTWPAFKGVLGMRYVPCERGVWGMQGLGGLRFEILERRGKVERGTYWVLAVALTGAWGCIELKVRVQSRCSTKIASPTLDE